jgi:hypothetical protein
MINEIQNRKHKAINLLTAIFLVCTLNSCAYQTNLTGFWKCDDGGTYHIRQNGHTVWWYGEQSSCDPIWANVAKGTIDGDNMVSLSWSNVPTGFIGGMSYGILFLKITSPDKLELMRETGGFSGSVWIPKPPEFVSYDAPGRGFAYSIVVINQSNESTEKKIYSNGSSAVIPRFISQG